MKLINFFLISIIIFSASSFDLFAQSGKTENSEIFPEFKAEDDMKPLRAGLRPFSISYGGWITSVLIDDRSGNDQAQAEIMSSVNIAKVWLRTALPYNTEIYLRARNIYSYYIDKPEGSGLDDSENDFDLDVGYVSIINGDSTLRGFLGRKYFMIGTGLLFNGRGDGGEISYYSKYVDVKVFGAYTGLLSEDTNPYRLSTKDFADNGRRVFIGGILSKTIYNQTLYLMGLYQMDNNDDIDDPGHPDAKTAYNSRYYGIGFNGTLQNAFYYGEFILEQGTSYTDIDTPENEEQNIKAMAARAGLNYFFDVKLRPVIIFDYAYGSGDADRDEQPSSPNGNTAKDDNGFLYFGTYVGGFALRPYLTNIHIYRIGLSLSPFYDFSNNLIKRINVIASYYNYQKDISISNINDGEATKPNKDIGQEIDLSLRWKIFSDFSFFANMGYFIPGSAYVSGEKNRTFIMGGINLSF
ncbi:MAG: alginate export family protein [Spirochaetes bacterium]|nr:alginate export family protein [Spirochaetota bacterium]